MKKIIKVKNPTQFGKNIAQKILRNVDEWKYLNEGYDGDVYYFKITKNSKFPKGEYILKVTKTKHQKGYSQSQIDRLTELSNLELIPKIYDIGDNYLIMKYVKGSNLLDLINKNKLSVSEKRDILQRLKHIVKTKWWDRGLVHGDLYPGNIIIGPNLEIVLIDPSLQDSQKLKIHHDRGELAELRLDLGL